MLIQGSMPKWLQDVSEATKTKLAESVRKALVLRAPRSAEELAFIIGHRWGMRIARRAVCEDHQTPFEFIERAFFQRDDRLFGMANKGGGKSLAFSIVHQLNAEFKPGLWATHVGATQAQALRVWEYLGAQLQREGLVGKAVDPLISEVAIKDQPLLSKIRWRNESRLEILAGTLAQVSGPHATVGAIDEFEQINWEVWQHFSKTLVGRDGYRAQMLLGSTRFRLGGPVMKLLQPPDGRPSPFRTITWCIYESMSRCTYDCQNVPGHLRMGDRPQCPLWSRIEIATDGTEQEVSMCHGRAHEGDGHLTPDTVISAYLMESEMSQWATLMELRAPSKRGLFFPECEPARHLSAQYEYVPGQGVYLGYDHGFNYPFALGAFQLRPDGFLYQFDEIYGMHRLVEDIAEDLRTRPWFADILPGDELGGWPDPSALDQIEKWNRWFMEVRPDHRPVMRWDTISDRQAGWRSVRARLWSVGGRPTIGWHPRCVNSWRDLEGLQQEEGKEDAKKIDDHGADMIRYVVHNLDRRMGRRAVDYESRRPEGSMDAIRKQSAAQAEVLVKQRWDQLIASGLKEAELKRLEANFPDDRDGFAKALGGLIAENTLGGRLQRAGFRGLDDDDVRPGDEEDR